MHDIRFIRENPEAFDAGLAKRGLVPMSGELIEIDTRRRQFLTSVEKARADHKLVSRDFAIAKKKADVPPDVTDWSAYPDLALLFERSNALKDRIGQHQTQADTAEQNLNDKLAAIPNLPADNVPFGEDEAGNVEVARWGTPRDFDFTPQDHADFGPALGLDFEGGAALSGARFTALRGRMARLHRALAQYMLDRQSGENGYEEVNPPLLVRDEALFGTGQLPKFADDLFRVDGDRWLIPTAEVSLTNLVAQQIVPLDTLPLRLTALTPCFRSEAGSAGRDTRGFIRQHQFEKVELVSICTPEQSEEEHNHMLKSAEGILQALNLPYRKMLLCTGDIGFSARKTFDLEVWLPSQQTYREISSVSNCGDFQARRMNARYKPEGEKQTRFLHTLNGSGLAVGRTLVAVLENYQQADGSVTVPDVLKKYMGDVTVLTPRPAKA